MHLLARCKMHAISRSWSAQRTPLTIRTRDRPRARNGVIVPRNVAIPPAGVVLSSPTFRRRRKLVALAPALKSMMRRARIELYWRATLSARRCSARQQRCVDARLASRMRSYVARCDQSLEAEISYAAPAGDADMLVLAASNSPHRILNVRSCRGSQTGTSTGLLRRPYDER